HVLCIEYSVTCTLLSYQAEPTYSLSLVPVMKPLLSRLVFLLAALVLVAPAFAQIRKGKRNELPVDDGRPPQATPIDQIKVKKDFRVELLYSVPRNQGSWVSMCVDPRGRLIVCD